MAYKVSKDGREVARVKASLAFVQEQFPGHDYEKIQRSRQSSGKQSFSPAELYHAFTSDEAIAAFASTNPAVVAQAHLLAVGRNVSVSIDDAGYQSAINLLESDGVLSADRAAAFRPGLPERGE
jgi:hypothetical protein